MYIVFEVYWEFIAFLAVEQSAANIGRSVTTEYRTESV